MLTFQRIWTIARWPLALIGLLLIVRYAYPRLGDAVSGAIEFGAEEGSIFDPATEPTGTETPAAAPTPVATLQPPTGPVTDGVNVAIVDLFVRDRVADVNSEGLLLADPPFGAPDDAIVVAFDLVDGDPTCLAQLTLGLTVEEVRSTTEIGVFTSSLWDVGALNDDQFVDTELRQVPAPMATALVETPGRLELDVLAGYQDYFRQGFPPGTPFVVTIAATVPIETDGGIRIVASEQENEETVPTLTHAGTPGCPVDTTATG